MAASEVDIIIIIIIIIIIAVRKLLEQPITRSYNTVSATHVHDSNQISLCCLATIILLYLIRPVIPPRSVAYQKVINRTKITADQKSKIIIKIIFC